MKRQHHREADHRVIQRGVGILFVSAFSLISVLMGIESSGSAAAASNGQWSVFPTAQAGQAPRPFVEPELTPGKVYADSVTVTNNTAAPLDFYIYAADAVNTPGGGLSLRPRTAVQEDMGSWVHLPYSTLSVPAHGATAVPFTIDPPLHATPGDHVGGIVTEDIQGTSSRAGSVPITVVQAVGVRVYGRVVGPLRPALALSHLSLSVNQSLATQFSTSVDASVRFSVHNSGNTVLSPVASVVLTTPIGTAAQKRFVVNEILPGSSLHYSLGFNGLNTFSHLQVEVSVAARGASASRGSAIWTVPWALLALILLAAGIVVWIMIRGLRNRSAASH